MKTSKSTSQPRGNEASIHSTSPVGRKPKETSPWSTRLSLKRNEAKLDKKVLVLDLEGTLIYSDDIPRKDMIKITIYSNDLRSVRNVSLRPGLKEFLEKMQKIYTLYLFTTEKKDVLDIIVQRIGIKQYFYKILDRSSCTSINKTTVKKEILKLNIPQEHILLVDDSWIYYEAQKQNFLQLKPFKGDTEDKELALLAEFLTGLAKDRDVRPVLKKYQLFLEEQGVERTSLQKGCAMSGARSFVSAALLRNSTKASNSVENCDDDVVNEHSVVNDVARNRNEPCIFDLMKESAFPKPSAVRTDTEETKCNVDASMLQPTPSARIKRWPSELGTKNVFSGAQSG